MLYLRGLVRLLKQALKPHHSLTQLLYKICRTQLCQTIFQPQKFTKSLSNSRQIRFPIYQTSQLVNSLFDRRYFIVIQKVCTSNFIKVPYIHSIVFSFNKNLRTFLLDNFISRNTLSLCIFVGHFKLHKLIYTLYYIH